MATYINPDVYVTVNNNENITSTLSNNLNICLVGAAPSSASYTDLLQFKNTNSVVPLTYPNVTVTGAGSVTPNVTATNRNSGSAFLLNQDYQLAVNATTGIVNMAPGITTIGVSSDTISGNFSLNFYENASAQAFGSTINFQYNATLTAIQNAIATALGFSISVTGATASTPSSGNVQYTTAAAHGLAVGTSVTIAGFSPSGYNGTFTVNTVTATTFTVTNATTGTATPTNATVTAGSFAITAQNLNATITGTSLSTGININFSPISSGTGSTLNLMTTALNVVSSTVNISSVFGNGSVVTYTTSAAHGFYAGQSVSVSGITPSGYSGVFTVASVPSATTFTVTNSTSTTPTLTNASVTNGVTTNTPSNPGAGITASSNILNTYVNANYIYTPTYGNVINYFNSPSAVQQVYGNAFDSTGAINSPITLAAQLAFQNGANSLYAMAVKPTSNGLTPTSSDWQTSINILLGNGAIDTIVPLVDYSALNLYTFFNNFINTQQNNGILQRLFLCRDSSNNVAVPQVTANTLQADASSFSNQRISIFAPTNYIINTTNQSTTQQVNVAGFYGAAAVAGVYTSLSGPQEPLTHKIVQGFYTIPNTYSTSDYLSMQSSGILCLKQRSTGAIYIRQGLTTSTTNWLTQEISIISAQDQLYRNIKNALVNANLIGTAFSNNTTNRILSNIQGTLGNAIANNLIQAYTNLQYSVPNNQPTSVNVTFAYSPTFPLNYINVTFGINPQAGTIQYSTTTNPYNTVTGV